SASGTGDASVAFTVAPNGGGDRSGTMTVAGRTMTVNQTAAAPSCTFSISPSSASVPPEGGSVTTAVTASGSSCPWAATATTNVAGWLSVTAGASGTGNGSVAVTATPNSGTARSGTVTIGGQALTVT